MTDTLLQSNMSSVTPKKGSAIEGNPAVKGIENPNARDMEFMYRVAENMEGNVQVNPRDLPLPHVLSSSLIAWQLFNWSLPQAPISFGVFSLILLSCPSSAQIEIDGLFTY